LESFLQIKSRIFCEEINNLCAANFDWARFKAQDSTLYFWNLIEKSSSKNQDGSSKYKLLSKVLRVTHSLPTSSDYIEQSFSCLKFIKNNLRSNLREETTLSLILIAQEFSNRKIIITDRMIDLYSKAKEE